MGAGASPTRPASGAACIAYQHALQKGVLLRPLGNVLYLMPPYTISEEELALVCEAAIGGVEAATRAI